MKDVKLPKSPQMNSRTVYDIYLRNVAKISSVHKQTILGYIKYHSMFLQ